MSDEDKTSDYLEVYARLLSVLAGLSKQMDLSYRRLTRIEEQVNKTNKIVNNLYAEKEG